MGLLILLVIFVFAPPSAGQKQPCGPLDWFQYNLRHSIYQPFIDRFSYILHAPPEQLNKRELWNALLPLPPFIGDPRLCESSGINGGLDVLQILFKIYSGGYQLPPLIGTNHDVYSQLYLFDICTEHVNKYDFHAQKLVEQPHVIAYIRECERATRLFHCATFNIAYAWPWLILFGLILLASWLVPLVACICFCCVFKKDGGGA